MVNRRLEEALAGLPIFWLSEKGVGLNRLAVFGKANSGDLPYESLGSLFKGRDTALAELRQRLGSDGKSAVRLTDRQAIHGLGGVGKTRLAIEYVSAHALCRRAMSGRGSGLEDLAQPLDRTPQLGCRLHSHFVHYLGAMRFDRALAGAEHVGDLLIEQAPHDKRKDLALARRQAFVASAPLPLLPPRFTRRGAPG